MGAPIQREQRSLFGEILDWMLAPLLLLWPMSVALTWLVAQSIANHPYDRELGELLRTLARQVAAQPAAGAPAQRQRFEHAAAQLLRPDDVDSLFFQVADAQGAVLAGDTDLPPPPDAPDNPGELHFRDATIGDEAVRVAYLWVPMASAGQPLALVQLAETLGKRSRLATEIIKGVILPQFVILPLAVLLVWFALVRGIRPLSELQRRIRLRESSDLSPIEDRHVPEEVAPLVASINDLLARLDQSIAAQRHFLADAAHQLKTPLAGLRTQAELAACELASGQGDRRSLEHSLQQIALSSQRAAHTVNQLLAMARTEDKEQALRREPVDLTAVTREAVRDFVPLALERRIDLGFEGPEAGGVPLLAGQPVLVRELVRNLIDNALQYTPAGGTVTARVTPDPFGQVIVLQVEDSGPGIPAHERDLVFQAFYRGQGTLVDGSGLGLAIVQEIAKAHDAEVSVTDAHPPRPGRPASPPGALFTVRFPLGGAMP